MSGLVTAERVNTLFPGFIVLVILMESQEKLFTEGYCLVCEERQPFRYIGTQRSWDRDFYQLYNCDVCDGTYTSIYLNKSIESVVDESYDDGGY